MAQDDKQHNMLFDLRGRRRRLVKAVYATLAVLMGLSLFLVIGGFNIAELFNSGSTTGEAAEQFEEQAERIEVKLQKEPENPDLLVALTRAQVNAANSQVTADAEGEEFPLESIQQWERAYQAWSEYLEATDEPSAGLALLMAPTIMRLAELARSFPQAESRIEAAVEAQKIAAEQRPSVNAFTTLALYTYFTGDFAAADKAVNEAKKVANTKAERKAIGQQLGEAEKRARQYLKRKERAEKQQKAAAEAAPEAFEPGENPLGGALGGGGLGE